jgi:predicted O-methyltransferase YrrM
MADYSYSSLQTYLTELVPERAAEIQSMEEIADRDSFPIIGPVAGQMCYQLARMIGAQRIFELGSGYGYSTAWFARAVEENGGGEVHHVVWNDGLSSRARGHLGAMGYDGMIHYHVGEAVQTLQGVDGPFDLVFNDIDKQGYPASLPVIADKLRSGGLLIIDNMLWQGEVFNADNRSADTEAIRETTRTLADDPDWITTLLPLRDGLIVAMKR